MKILEANAGVLSNFEVLDFLQTRGYSKGEDSKGKDSNGGNSKGEDSKGKDAKGGDSKGLPRVLLKLAPSELKVNDYLVESVSCNQTREKVREFVEKCKKFKLAKAEVLNIINIWPSSVVEIVSLVDQMDLRFEEEQLEELVGLVTEVLPLHPPNKENAQDKNEVGTAATTGEQAVEGEITEDVDIASDGQAMDDDRLIVE